jgi:hypothetical protein
MFGVETRPWARCTRVRILAGARDFLFQSPNQFWGPCSLLFIGSFHWVISQGSSSWGMKLTTHHCPVLMFRIYAYMPSWNGRRLHLLFYLYYFIFILVRITVSRCVRYIYEVYIINSCSPAVFVSFLWMLSLYVSCLGKYCWSHIIKWQECMICIWTGKWFSHK